MKQRWFYSLILVAIFFCTELYSQKIDEKFEAEASKLKTTFKDADVIALTSVSSYHFSADKRTMALIASQEDQCHYISTKANTEFIITTYYNDQSYIDSYSIKTENGKSYNHDKYCGHFKSEDIFYSDAQICAYKLTMDVKGRTALYKSTKIFRDTKYLTHVFFHSETPSKKREVIISIPSWVNVELVEKNFEEMEIKKAVTKNGDNTVYTYTVENLKAAPKDSDLPGSLHYLPHILILTKSYNYNGKQVTVLSSTDDLYKWYSSLTATIKRDDGELKPVVNKLTAGLKTDEEKIKAIYYWVQDNIKYIAFEDGLAAYKPEDAHEVYYKRYGDCKGMANLTKEMLILAGYDARLTWIGTDRIPYGSDVPSLAVNNHMICTVLIGGKRYILDSTEKYCPLGEHGERIQGKDILVENGASYMVAKVPEDPLDHYLQEWFWKFEVKDQALVGKGVVKVNGEYKKILLNVMNSIKNEDTDKVLKSVVSGSSNPDNFKIENHSVFDREKTLTIDYNINLKNNVSLYDKELYIDMDFDDDFKNTKMDRERIAPYKFNSKVLKKIQAELTIPAGYKIKYLPEAFHAANEHFVFDVKYVAKGNKVIYTKEIKILDNMLPVSEFKNWNSTVEELSKFYNDQIILQIND